MPKNPEVLVCPRDGPWVGEQVSPQDQILANEEEEEKFSCSVPFWISGCQWEMLVRIQQDLDR